MLNDFVVQYDKAVNSRRSAEREQDLRILNSKLTLHSDHPIEAIVAKCYTRNIYEIFKKEWKASGDWGHEKISKVYELVKYHVGFIKVTKNTGKLLNIRWTMKATYNVGSIGTSWSGVHGNATQQ
ncbi:FAR1-related sequence 5-like protein, partial [Tanacetum coccineum]